MDLARKTQNLHTLFAALTKYIRNPKQLAQSNLLRFYAKTCQDKNVMLRLDLIWFYSNWKTLTLNAIKVLTDTLTPSSQWDFQGGEQRRLSWPTCIALSAWLNEMVRLMKTLWESHFYHLLQSYYLQVYPSGSKVKTFEQGGIREERLDSICLNLLGLVKYLDPNVVTTGALKKLIIQLCLMQSFLQVSNNALFDKLPGYLVDGYSKGCLVDMVPFAVLYGLSLRMAAKKEFRIAGWLGIEALTSFDATSVNNDQGWKGDLQGHLQDWENMHNPKKRKLQPAIVDHDDDDHDDFDDYEQQGQEWYLVFSWAG